MITNETKVRFARMLAKHQIIVIQCKKSTNCKRYDFKFIGADGFNHYDFTPMVSRHVELATCQGHLLLFHQGY